MEGHRAREGNSETETSPRSVGSSPVTAWISVLDGVAHRCGRDEEWTAPIRVTNAAATMAATAIARRFKPVAAVTGRVSDVAGPVDYNGWQASRKHAGYLCRIRGRCRDRKPMGNRRNAANQVLCRGLAAGRRRRLSGAEACRGSGSCACETSAIILLMMASPKELKFFATMTKAPGPPMTLLR